MPLTDKIEGNRRFRLLVVIDELRARKLLILTRLSMGPTRVQNDTNLSLNRCGPPQ